MAYTLNANYIKAMGRATVEPVVHCSIALSGTTMDFHNSPEAVDSTVTGDPILGEVTTVSQSVDPVSRKVQHGEMTFTLVDDGKIRGLVSSQSFNEKVITVKLGSTELALSDFVGIFKGPIISVMPQEGRIIIKARSFTHQFKGVKTYRTYMGEHPFSVVSQLLQDCGVAAGDIDSTSFTPANHTDISHYNFSSVVTYNTGLSAPPALQDGIGVESFEGSPEDAPNVFADQEINIENFVNETMRLTRSTLVHDPASGDIKIVRYDSSAAVTKHFTTDEYTDFQQIDPAQGIITEVKTAFGKIAGTDLLMQSDNTAATNLGASDYSHTVNYLSGSSMVLANTLVGGATALTSLGGEGGISGTRGVLLGGSQPADAKVSADRPFYALYRSEILKSTTAFSGLSNASTIHSARDHDGDLTGSTISGPLGFSTTLVSRPFAGTEVDTGGATTGGNNIGVIIDATPAFEFGEYIVNRFSNTCPVVSILVGLEHLNLEIGDLVSIDNDLFLSTELGLDGLDSTVKLEITKREILPLGDSIGIELELSYATKSSPPSVTITSKPPRAVTSDFGRIPPSQMIASRSGTMNRSLLDNQTNSMAVTATSGLGISIAGGIAAASGLTLSSNEAHTLTMTASKHTYLGLNLLTGGIIKQEVTVGAAEPDLAAGELRLAKVITNGSAVTGVTDLRAFGVVSVEQLDKQALNPGQNLVWNPGFDIWQDPGVICPGWAVTSGAIGTDLKRSGPSGVHSGKYKLNTTDTSTVATVMSSKVPINRNRPYRAAAWVYQDGSHAITLKIFWWQDDRTASSTASSTIYGASPSDSAWINIGGVASPPSDASYASIELSRAANPGDEGFWDDVSLTEEPVSFNAQLTGSNQVLSGTGEVVIFNTEKHDYGSNYNNSSGVFTVPESGVYAFTSTLSLVGAVNVRAAYVTISGSTAGVIGSASVEDGLLGTDEWNDLAVTVSATAAELVAGETVSVKVYSSSAYASVDFLYSWFSGRKIS